MYTKGSQILTEFKETQKLYKKFFKLYVPVIKSSYGIEELDAEIDRCKEALKKVEELKVNPFFKGYTFEEEKKYQDTIKKCNDKVEAIKRRKRMIRNTCIVSGITAAFILFVIINNTVIQPAQHKAAMAKAQSDTQAFNEYMGALVDSDNASEKDKKFTANAGKLKANELEILLGGNLDGKIDVEGSAAKVEVNKSDMNIRVSFDATALTDIKEIYGSLTVGSVRFPRFSLNPVDFENSNTGEAICQAFADQFNGMKKGESRHIVLVIENPDKYSTGLTYVKRSNSERKELVKKVTGNKALYISLDGV